MKAQEISRLQVTMSLQPLLRKVPTPVLRITLPSIAHVVGGGGHVDLKAGRTAQLTIIELTFESPANTNDSVSPILPASTSTLESEGEIVAVIGPGDLVAFTPFPKRPATWQQLRSSEATCDTLAECGIKRGYALGPLGT